MINFIRGIFFLDKNFFGLLFFNLRYSIVVFLIYGFDRYFFIIFDIVSKIELG